MPFIYTWTGRYAQGGMPVVLDPTNEFQSVNEYQPVKYVPPASTFSAEDRSGDTS